MKTPSYFYIQVYTAIESIHFTKCGFYSFLTQPSLLNTLMYTRHNFVWLISKLTSKYIDEVLFYLNLTTEDVGSLLKPLSLVPRFLDFVKITLIFLQKK